ncbi:MAG TPA: DUF5134 domain-containing protein [Jiangellaceae bacterium]
MTGESVLASTSVVVFSLVALYCVLRLAYSVCPRRSRAPAMSGERACDVAHAVMAAAMALMFSSAAGLIAPAGGVVVFALMGAWFAAKMLHHGAGSRVGASRGRECRHSTYNFHLVAASVAMIFMYTSHQALGDDTPTVHAGGVGAAAAGSDAHHSLPLAVIVGWLLALYFVVAAASLGFRVDDPEPIGAGPTSPSPPSSPRFTSHRHAARHGTTRHGTAGRGPAPTRARVGRWLVSPTWALGCEVIMSTGMALMLFAAL